MLLEKSRVKQLLVDVYFFGSAILLDHIKGVRAVTAVGTQTLVKPAMFPLSSPIANLGRGLDLWASMSFNIALRFPYRPSPMSMCELVLTHTQHWSSSTTTT